MFDGILRNGKTYDELNAEIDALTIKDTWVSVMPVLYENMLFANQNSEGATGELFYKGIKVYQEVDGKKVFSTKLPYSDYLEAETQYKNALKDDLTVSFTLLENEKLLGDRFDDLKSPLLAAARLSIFTSYKNKDLLRKHVISTGDDANLTLLEAEDLLIEDEDTFQGEVEVNEKKIRFGQRVLATLGAYNERNNVTALQSAAIMSNTDVQTIVALLQVGAIETSRPLIAALDLTGLEPLTETERTAILALVDDHLS